MDVRVLVRYPFLPAAGAHAAEHGPSLEELLEDPVYARIRDEGRARVLSALDEGAIASADAPTDEVEALFELLTYPVGRMLVSACADPYVTRRHALAEAVRVKGFLDREADTGIVLAVARELGVGAELVEGGSAGERRFRVHFTDYVRFADRFKDPAWKLVNQPLSGGFVSLPQVKLARVCQEALRLRLEDVREVPREVKALLAADVRMLADAAKVRREQYEATAFGPVDPEAFPPCMRQILGMLQAGENAPHSARFAITTFLNAIGLDSEEIMKLFAVAPDFREDLTRYQVEHITGKTSSTTYSPPGCQAMVTYGICYEPDKWCTMTNREGERYVTHPLSYYRWAVKRKGVPVSGPGETPSAAGARGGSTEGSESGAADAAGTGAAGSSAPRDPA